VRRMKSVEEAKEIARRATRRIIRKTLGKYYLLWSTYPLAIGVLYILTPPSLLENPLPYILTLIPYLTLTSYFFMDMGKKLRRYKELIGWKSRRRVSLLIVLMLAGFVMLVLGHEPGFNYLLILGLSLYTSTVDYYIYYTASFARFRYYDLLTMVTFSISMFVWFLPLPYSEALYLVMSVVWIFSGYSSLSEVIEDV